MNFKNLSENLIIVIVAALAGGYIGYNASVKSNKQATELLTPTITEAIRKETTAIKNDIQVEVKKIKNSDSLTLNVSQRPDSHITQQVKASACVPVGYTLIKTQHLTRRQKRRLNLLN